MCLDCLDLGSARRNVLGARKPAQEEPCQFLPNTVRGDLTQEACAYGRKPEPGSHRAEDCPWKLSRSRPYVWWEQLERSMNASRNLLGAAEPSVMGSALEAALVIIARR